MEDPEVPSRDGGASVVVIGTLLVNSGWTLDVQSLQTIEDSCLLYLHMLKGIILGIFSRGSCQEQSKTKARVVMYHCKCADGAV